MTTLPESTFPLSGYYFSITQEQPREFGIRIIPNMARVSLQGE